ncbi:hypothetical protein MK489_17565 [Myxococcota bacterium]|nr:hypothetical protein [Myxococcota bacterium]
MSSPDHERAIEHLDLELSQLKFAYDQYFLGAVPREPVTQRSKFDRALRGVAARQIQNTGLRFRRSGIGARYQALSRQWNDTLRKIEQGTYTRHQFRAQIHGNGAQVPEGPNGGSREEIDDLLAAVRDAQRNTSGPSPSPSRAKLAQWVADQRAALKHRHGDVEVCFRVVVSEGRIKLQAARVNR